MSIVKASAGQLYAILGVEPGASILKCEQAYKAKLIELHPDNFSIADPRRKRAEEELRTIADALNQIKRWKISAQKEQDQLKREEAVRNAKLNSMPVKVRIIKD